MLISRYWFGSGNYDVDRHEDADKARSGTEDAVELMENEEFAGWLLNEFCRDCRLKQYRVTLRVSFTTASTVTVRFASTGLDISTGGVPPVHIGSLVPAPGVPVNRCRRGALARHAGD